MKEYEEKKTFWECECHCEILSVGEGVEVFETLPKRYRREWYFAMFHGYGTGKYKLWDRIKYAWRILTTGKPHTDQLILTDKQMGDLVSFVKERDDVLDKWAKENGLEDADA